MIPAESSFLKGSDGALASPRVDNPLPPGFPRAPLAMIRTSKRHDCERPQTCQARAPNSERSGDKNSAGCWLSPRAQKRAPRRPRSARAPSRKSILRARGGEGKGVWACGSRGGTKEPPRCQPTRRYGRYSQPPSGAKRTAPPFPRPSPGQVVVPRRCALPPAPRGPVPPTPAQRATAS